MYGLERWTVYALTSGFIFVLVSRVAKHQNGTRVSTWTVQHDSIYIIPFLTRHDEPKSEVKKTIFTHWHSVALALFTFWWWHHNWLCNAGDDVTVDLATVMPSREKLYIYISLYIVLFMVIFTVGRVRRFSSPVVNIFWARTLWSP